MGKTSQLIARLSGKESRETWGIRNSAAVAIASSLRFDSVSYSIDGMTILQDISLEVAPGEVMCLLGPSGSGKTSLLRVAAGLIASNSGKVLVDGRVIADENHFVPPEHRGIGMVFQDYALFPHLTVVQNVAFGLNELGKAEAREQAMRLLSRVGLASRANDYPTFLSGGEQQRVALARALAPRPGILLMDEPFSGLDSRLRDVIREQTLELLKETRTTCIIVTHDPEEALRVGDQIALIRDGKLVQNGSARDLYFQPNSIFTASFFSEVNIVPASHEDSVVKTAFCEVKAVKGTTREVCAAIRHTDIAVKPYQNLGDGKVGRISTRRFAGTSELLEILVEELDEPIHARIRAGELPQDASLVLLKVKPKDVMVLETDL